MSRYIDADKFDVFHYEKTEGRENTFDDGVMFVLEKIDEALTEDVAPIVHAEWEWYEEWLPSIPEHPAECQVAEWRCSNCKKLLSDLVGDYWNNIENPPKLKYCPHCGAKMKADGNEDKEGK